MERTVTRTGDNRPCVANYSTEGGFWTGKQFKTYEEFPTLDRNAKAKGARLRLFFMESADEVSLAFLA